jgi:hypothetical protein
VNARAFKRAGDAEHFHAQIRHLAPKLYFQSGFKRKPWVVATKAPKDAVELLCPIVWEANCAKLA